MIRENSLFCKLIRIKTSSKTLFDVFMAGFRPELQTCPCCGVKDSCSIHAYYGRSLVDFMGAQPLYPAARLSLQPYLCHPPRLHHLLFHLRPFFILRVLAEYFLRLTSVERLCERFLITQKQLYCWLALFKWQKEEWLGMLPSMETSGFSFLKGILKMPGYSGLAFSFVLRFSVSFLRSHRNPAPCCQQISGP